MGARRARLAVSMVGTLVLAPILDMPGGLATPSRRGPVTVRMTPDHTFEPQVLRIRPGDEVIWKNEDRGVHSVVGDPLRALHRSDIEPPSPPEPFHSDDLSPDQTYTHRFTLEGVYRYVCPDDEDRGMNGTIIVRP